MKNVLLSVFLLLVFSCQGVAADIVAPETVKPWQLVSLPIEGLDGTQIPTAIVDWEPRSDVTVIPALTFNGKPFLMYQRTTEGHQALWISYMEKDQTVGYVRVDFDVSGESPNPPGPPDPPDPPDPPVPPSPDQAYQIKIFQETGDADQYTEDQNKIMNSLVFEKPLEEKGHVLKGVYDISSQAQAGWPVQQSCYVDRWGRQVCGSVKAPPSDVGKEWWDAVKGKPTPVVAVAPVEGGTIRTFALPKTEAEFWKELGQ